jgi:hypothetical protein
VHDVQPDADVPGPLVRIQDHGRPLVAYGSAADDDMREALGLPEPACDVDDEVDADVVDDPVLAVDVARAPSAQHATSPRGYKPGTRILNEHAPSRVTGERPWWSSEDPKVWQEKQEAFKRKGGLETRNVIGWNETGLTGGRG